MCNALHFHCKIFTKLLSSQYIAYGKFRNKLGLISYIFFWGGYQWGAPHPRNGATPQLPLNQLLEICGEEMAKGRVLANAL